MIVDVLKQTAGDLIAAKHCGLKGIRYGDGGAAKISCSKFSDDDQVFSSDLDAETSK